MSENALEVSSHHLASRWASQAGEASETVAASDYDNLVKLLSALGQRLNDAKLAPPLKTRLESLFASRRTLLAR